MSAPPDPSAPGTPVPQVGTLESVGAQVAAIDRLIALGQQSIRVFDRDLSQLGWNGAGRTALVATFLRSSPQARLDIIVHNTRWLESACPRLTGLLRQFAHRITVYRTGAEARAAADPLVLVDGRHFLHRFHIDHPRAALGIDAPHEARPLVSRYDEIWATGEPGLTATLLGL